MDQTESPNLARVYSRLAAYLIDTIIIALISIPVAIIAGLVIILVGAGTAASLTAVNLSVLSIPAIIILGIASTIIMWLIPSTYYAYFQSKSGQTPGLKFIGIKLTSEDGSLVNFWRALLRTFAAITIISIISNLLGLIPFIGALLSLLAFAVWIGWCVFDKKAQNLYDKIFKTIYVATNEETGRAKWVIGCCGCPLFLVIAVSLVAAIVGLGSYTLKNIPASQTTTTNTMMQKEEQVAQPATQTTTTTTTSTTKTISNSSSIRNSEFYKACTSSAPTGVDFSAYCECATKEFDSGQTDVNAIVNSCKSYLQQ